MDGDLGHSSRLRDGGQYHMPSGAAYGPFSSHVCTATMALAVRHDTAVSGEGDPITDRFGSHRLHRLTTAATSRMTYAPNA